MRLLMLSEARTVHARRWAIALVRRGWTVSMLSVSETVIPGVEVIPLHAPRFGLHYPRRWQERYRMYVRDVFRRVAPDVAHIHYLHAYHIADLAGNGGVGATPAGRSVNVPRPPLVISTWGSDVTPEEQIPLDAPRERQDKIALLRQADAVTATTHYLAGRTAEYSGIDVQRITVIPFGIDPQRFDPAPRRPIGVAPVIGFIKHLEPKYGVEVLLRATSQVVRGFPRVRLILIGRGSLERELKHLASRLGLDSRVEWRGAIDHADVPAALQEMDVFAMPSISESFGVSAVEAQAAGVPVVCTDLPGVREAVIDGVGGLTVPPGDAAALAKAIGRLLDDAELRRRLAEGGRKWVERNLVFDDNVAAMERVYERVLGNQPKRVARRKTEHSEGASNSADRSRQDTGIDSPLTVGTAN